MARAAGTDASQPEPRRSTQTDAAILIHGDAAFPGQDRALRRSNLSALPGYWTGGTIHIITNNQLGFTTEPGDSRSTLYASDLAKGFKMPIASTSTRTRSRSLHRAAARMPAPTGGASARIS